MIQMQCRIEITQGIKPFRVQIEERGLEESRSSLVHLVSGRFEELLDRTVSLRRLHPTFSSSASPHNQRTEGKLTDENRVPSPSHPARIPLPTA